MFSKQRHYLNRFSRFFFCRSKNVQQNSMVLDEAVEIDSKKNSRSEVGRILLKGDSIALLQVAQPVRQA